jgi:hypothetical protein
MWFGIGLAERSEEHLIDIIVLSLSRRVLRKRKSLELKRVRQDRVQRSRQRGREDKRELRKRPDLRKLSATLPVEAEVSSHYLKHALWADENKPVTALSIDG